MAGIAMEHHALTVSTVTHAQLLPQFHQPQLKASWGWLREFKDETTGRISVLLRYLLGLLLHTDPPLKTYHHSQFHRPYFRIFDSAFVRLATYPTIPP